MRSELAVAYLDSMTDVHNAQVTKQQAYDHMNPCPMCHTPKTSFGEFCVPCASAIPQWSADKYAEQVAVSCDVASSQRSQQEIQPETQVCSGLNMFHSFFCNLGVYSMGN